jgi:hypothetical protein
VPAAAPQAATGGDPAGLESRLVWIWGSPRSGSTWLLKLLAHPLDPDPESALGFREPGPGASGPFDSVPVDETFISNHLSPALADPRIVAGRWVPGTLNNLLATKPAYVFSDEYADVWEPAARTMALTRLGGVLEKARAAGIPLTPDPAMVIKETNGSHAADIVMRVMPSSRLLLLIRDGRDVVDSLMAANQPGGFMASKLERAFETPEERAEGLGWAARLWACNTDMTLKAIESHDPALARVVRYEDLLADTVGEMRGLNDWLGLERSDEWLARLAEAHSFSALPAGQTGPLTRNRAAKPGLWRENLSDEEQRTVNEICGPLLERFGYEL